MSLLYELIFLIQIYLEIQLRYACRATKICLDS